MTRILTTIHLSDIQQEVLAKVKAAPTPHVAWSTIAVSAEAFDQNFAAARDVLGNLGLLNVGDGTLEITDKGLEVMNDENLTDEMGELTDQGRALADIPRDEAPTQQNVPSAEQPASDQELGGLPMESMTLVRAINENANLPKKLSLTEETIPVTRDVIRMMVSDAQRFMGGDLDYYSLPVAVQSALLAAFSDIMPYGVQKARTGTPDEWLLDRDPAEVLSTLRNHLYGMMERGERIWT